MMSPEDSKMKQALQSRRGKGLDISIILGEPKVDENKATDLAPKPQSMMAGGDLHGAPEAPQPMSHDQVSPDGMAGMKDSDLVSGMDEMERKSLSDREPRSLGERARKEAVLRGPGKV